MGRLKALKANVVARYKASAEDRKAYSNELRAARQRQNIILANERAVLERKQKIAKIKRRPQTIGRALGFTRSLGQRAKGGAGRTLGIQGRQSMKKIAVKGKAKFKKVKRRRSPMKNNSYNNDNDYGMGGFGFG